MKKIIRHPIGASTQAEERDILLQSTLYEEVDIPHDSQALFESAGYIINKKLRYSENFEPSLFAKVLTVSLNPSDHTKASLYKRIYLHDIEMEASRQGREEMARYATEKAVEELLEMALDSNDRLYKMRKSFWARLKFLFIPLSTPRE